MSVPSLASAAAPCRLPGSSAASGRPDVSARVPVRPGRLGGVAMGGESFQRASSTDVSSRPGTRAIWWPAHIASSAERIVASRAIHSWAALTAKATHVGRSPWWRTGVCTGRWSGNSSGGEGQLGFGHLDACEWRIDRESNSNSSEGGACSHSWSLTRRDALHAAPALVDRSRAPSIVGVRLPRALRPGQVGG